MNCYNCKHRAGVLGSCHSSCEHPILGDSLVRIVGMLEPTLFNGVVDMDPVGVKRGWCNFPIDFDPTWIKSCTLFEEKKDAT